MNNVYVVKLISNIVKNDNVTSVTFTNDVCSKKNTVAFQKWALVLSQNRCFFSNNVKIKYGNQQLNDFPAGFR